MTTVEIHKDILSEASSAYSQRKLQAAMLVQQSLIDKRMCRKWPFRPKTRILAAIEMGNTYGNAWWRVQEVVDNLVQDDAQIQTACRVSEGYVSVDLQTVYKLFGE